MKTLLAILGSTSLLLVCACSDVKLMRNTQTPTSISALSGTFCSAAADNNASTLNVVFVIDMSGSNIEGNPSNPPLPTDLDEKAPGSRFSIVKSFPNLPCVSGRTNIRYAAVGFSSLVLPSNTCNASLFGDASKLSTEVEALRGIQTTEKTYVTSSGTNSGSTMRNTSYVEGFNCANSLIQSHLSSLSPAEQINNGYLVYFLTDGAPTDANTIPQEESMIGPTLDQMASNANNAGGIKIQPILYGMNQLSSTELSNAKDILTFIGNKGGSTPVTIDKVSDTDFCALMNSSKKQPYIVANFGVANLTALMKKNRLIPDSDIDGIADEEESSRGFDPANPRSGASSQNYVLDGMCPKGSTAAQCAGFNSCSNPNALGFSDCEIGAYSLTDGLDSNKNLIPDNIEFLKGASPNIDQSLTDLDGDGMLLWQELAVGRDPNFYDSGIDPSLLVKYDHHMLSDPLPGCDAGQQSWTYSITNIPLVPTLAVKVTDPITSKSPQLIHSAGENIVFIYYFVKKADENPAAPSAPLLYGRFLKVQYSSGAVTGSSGDFVQLGAANGVFVPGN